MRHSDSVISGQINDVGIAIPYWELISGTNEDRVTRLDKIAGAGCHWLRTDIYWYAIEDTQAVYNWSAFDAIMTGSQQRGMQVLAVIHTIPDWARPAGAPVTHGPTTALEQDLYAAFCAKAVERYGTTIAAYEIWNEQNLDQFWSPTPSAPSYTTLLKKAYVAMKAVNPQVKIITGGTGGAMPDGKDIDPEVFITGIYNAGGRGYFDGVAVHPYTNKDGLMGGGLWQAVTRIRPLMDARGDASVMLWGTETGTPTKGLDSANMTEAASEQLVPDTFAYWRAMHNAGPIMWYTLQDLSSTANDVESYFGLLRYDGREKLAYQRLKQAAGQPVQLVPQPSSYPARVVSITQYGAAANGTTDDTQALVDAISAVQSTGGVITIPDSKVRIVLGSRNWINIPSNITIRGLGASSTITIESPNGNYHELFRMTGSNICLEKLTLHRKGNLYGAMLNVNNASNVWLNRLHIDGQQTTSSTTEFHGIFLAGSPGVVSDGLSIVGTTLRRCDFGLLHSSNDTATFRNILVQGCLFEDNLASDLEFNAPDSIMQGVDVIDSTFRNNLSQGPSAGWSIGLANVQDSQISGNGITGYIMNGIHIEDDSANVVIERNLFSAVSTKPTGYESAVFIISGSHDISVKHNTFDNRQQTNQIDCVYVGPGGAGYANPYNVNATLNTVYLANNSSFIGMYGGSNIVSTPNTFL